jgi:hypothetical protein
MSLQQLGELYLYDLLPEALITLDEQGLIAALMGGYGDRVDDLRSFTSKFELFMTGDGLPETDSAGNPLQNVVLCQIQSDHGVIYNRSLDFQDDTPANTDPNLLIWAANILHLPEGYILLGAAYGIDALRLVTANTLANLASTVGAVLYQTAAMNPANANSDGRRLLDTWFPRLQFKGTAESFEALGRLLGFDDVRMTPLFGRLSPRIANDIGDPNNDQDFAVLPDYQPKQARDNYYDPWVLNDGPFYTWTGTASALYGTNNTLFYTQVVNGFNPFISVTIVGENPTDPNPAGSPYILGGGGPELPASVSAGTSGLLFQAISAGSSFNGLAINVLPIQNGSLTVLSITDRLSAIKYRSSYYDLGLTLDPQHALQQFGTDVATPNNDLIANPTIANFGSIAVSPFRPWQSGSIYQPVNNVDWLPQVVTTGAFTVVAYRTQADLTSRQYDMALIQAAGAQVAQAMEEVRPATRSARDVNVGFLFQDQAAYASYLFDQTIAITLAGQSTLSGTLTGFPLPPYSAEFLAITTGTQALVGETDLINSGFVRLRSTDLTINGTFNYGNATWQLTFANTNGGTNIVVEYTPTSTQIIRPNPVAGVPVAYQVRPEDFLNKPNYTKEFADEYPWRRDVVMSGELVDFDSYQPAQADLVTLRLGQTAAVKDQTGSDYDVQVIVPGPYPPRFVNDLRSIDPANTYIPAQPAIAFTGTFLNLAGPRPISGTLLGGLDGVMQPGWQLYHFGLVQGVLVADPQKFFGSHHRTGLALWYPFNEQPLDAIEIVDHSVYAGNGLIAGINPTDRHFDPVRGNFLSAKVGMQITTTIDRGFATSFSGGFWLRALHSYAAEDPILIMGPFEVTITGNGPSPTLNFYLTDPYGNQILQASQVIDQNWNYVAWSFDGQQFLTINYFNNAGVLTQQIIQVVSPINYTIFDNIVISGAAATFDIQDLRIWNIPKSWTDLALSRNHSPTPTACLYRPTWLESANTYDHYAVRVLPSGFLVPEQLPTSIITNKLAWVERYDYLGIYGAQDRYKQTGLGSGVVLPARQLLGMWYDTLTANGTVVVSTGTGQMPGVNSAWLFDNPIGQVLTLVESGSTGIGIPPSWVSTGANSPWPNPLLPINPCLDSIWVLGDNSSVYEVTLGNPGGIVSLVTKQLFSVSGSYLPSGGEMQLTNSTMSTKLSISNSGTIYAGVYSGTVTSAPLYMYANALVDVSLTGANLVNTWVQPNSFGLGQNPPVAAIKSNGQIGFQVTNTLQPGFYSLAVTSGNIGAVDANFSGFDVVITVGDLPFQAKLCAGETGANFKQTGTFQFYLPHTLPGSPSSWLLTFDWSNSLVDTVRGTQRQLEISSVVITNFAPALYEVQVGASVTLTGVSTSSVNYPTTPGGWLALVTSWGTASSYSHESTVYNNNDTIMTPWPLSNRLTTTTAKRREDIIMTSGGTNFDLPIPAFIAYGSIFFE